MSLGTTVALVAATLAVVSGTSYVSLMDGGASSRAPDAEHLLSRPDRGSGAAFPAYFDDSFASLRATTRTAREVTGSIAPRTTFAERFAGVTSNATGATKTAMTRSLAAPKLDMVANSQPFRSAVLRIDERETAPEQKSYRVASYAPTRDDSVAGSPFRFRADIRVPPLRQAITSLVPFENAPFPFKSASYSDPRVLLHIPKGFDINKPSVMVVFFHGHGATLSRDVLNRQQVPEQISEAGANAVLVAPQLAFDAADSSPGKLWEPGAFARLVRESGEQLTRLYGDPRVAHTFANMPVIIVAYSGGYLSAATSLERGGLKNRIRGVVLLDALYGELDGFADWISHNRKGFFVSAYTRSTKRRNSELEHMLSQRDVTFASALKPARLDGSVTFLAGEDGIRHRDFVNHAWADKPIRDILTRLPEYRL